MMVAAPSSPNIMDLPQLFRQLSFPRFLGVSTLTFLHHLAPMWLTAMDPG